MNIVERCLYMSDKVFNLIGMFLRDYQRDKIISKIVLSPSIPGGGGAFSPPFVELQFAEIFHKSFRPDNLCIV